MTPTGLLGLISAALFAIFSNVSRADEAKESKLSALAQQLTYRSVVLAYYDRSSYEPIGEAILGRLENISCGDKKDVQIYLVFPGEDDRNIRIPNSFVFMVHKSMTGQPTKYIRNKSRIYVYAYKDGVKFIHKKSARLGYFRKEPRPEEWMKKGSETGVLYRTMSFSARHDNSIKAPMEYIVLPVGPDIFQEMRNVCSM